MGGGWGGGGGGGLTGVVELVAGVAEDFEGAAELLGAEGGVQCEEDLDHVGGVVKGLGGGGFGDCTHLGGWVVVGVRFMYGCGSVWRMGRVLYKMT